MKPRKPRDITRIMGIQRDLEKRGIGKPSESQNPKQKKPDSKAKRIPKTSRLALSKLFTDLKGQIVSPYLTRFFAAAFRGEFSVFLGENYRLAFRALEKPRHLENGRYALRIGIGDVDEKPEPFGEIIFSMRGEQFRVEDFRIISGYSGTQEKQSEVL